MQVNVLALIAQEGQGASLLVVGLISPTILSASSGKTRENTSHKTESDGVLSDLRF